MAIKTLLDTIKPFLNRWLEHQIPIVLYTQGMSLKSPYYVHKSNYNQPRGLTVMCQFI